MKNMRQKSAAAGVVILLVSACTVGPDYHRPPVDTPAFFKEQSVFQPAQPANADHGAWWSVYHDAVLDQLLQKVAVSNQNLIADAAAYREATAAVELARSSFFPTVTLNGTAERTNKPSLTNNYNFSGAASWAPDIWGRIRRTVESSKANAEASAADLAAATLSSQGTLAVDYFSLRAADQLKRILDDTVVADTRSLQITKNQYKAGIVSKADVAQAQTQVDSVEAQAISVGVTRAQLEHAIAVLIGKPPAAFSIKPVEDGATGYLPDAPVVPVSVPSALLQRRPDIAASERQMAASNALIGVAISAYFPNLTLAGSAGYAGSSFGNLLEAPNEVWSVGPQMALTLFNAGATSAQVKEARATYEQSVALYRQTVLTGFQQVEDELAAIRILSEQEKAQRKAVQEAKEAERLILNQYTAGTVSYTSVVTAQTATLGNQQAELAIRSNLLTASVQLIQALGGGWDSAALTTFSAGAP